MLEHKQSITITTRFDTPSSGRFTHYEPDRCITVREAARIQSFPDSFTFCWGKEIPDAAGWQCGSATACPSHCQAGFQMVHSALLE